MFLKKVLTSEFLKVSFGKFRTQKANFGRNLKIIVFSSKFTRQCGLLSSNLNRENYKRMSDFVYPNDVPITLVDCEKPFNLLSDKEKLYAHYLSKACFYGGLIILPQTSLESSLIFVLLHKLFKAQPISELKEVALQKCNFTEDEFVAMLVYSAGIFCHLGNYKGFEGTKFIPNLPKEKFHNLLMASQAAKLEPEKIRSLISKCIEIMFSLEDNEKLLGLPYDGKTTTFLSKNITKEDQEIVTEFFKNQDLEAYNTRLFKTFDSTGSNCYEIRLASVLQTEDEEKKNLLSSQTVNDNKFIVTRGDYSKLLKIVNKYLHQAKEFATNENETKMIENYIQSFHTGSIEDHKEASRYWVKDKGPIVETYLGFVETYKDPAGIRASFEGFVAMVDKDLSVKFSNLVSAATDILPLLPWPAEYEKNTFLCPDFTSLHICTFAAEDIPIGICIPNYLMIRQNEGFKNVYLQNIVTSTPKKNIKFLCKDDQELLEKCSADYYEVGVGLHELYGHGCGKLFKMNEDGKLNFNINEVKHSETGEKITKYYEVGESFDSVFSSLSNPYEECRAECVALYLCIEPVILRIFGFEAAEANKIMFCVWLDMLYKGLKALEVYEPKTGSWIQAHSQARYVILQVCLEAGEGFISIKRLTGADGNPDLLLTVDNDKIETVGKKAIGNFLRKLQVYKSTADITSAKEMFDKYSAVTSEGKHPFLDYHEIVMARKTPRNFKVQANTVIKNGKVCLLNYESTPEGLIKSCVERFQDENVDDILEEIWEKDKPHF